MTDRWYISAAHARRALGYLGAALAEGGDLRPEFEQPILLDLWGAALEATIEAHDLSPVDEQRL